MENLFSSHFSQLSQGPERSPSMADFENLLQVVQNFTPNHDDEVVPPSAMMTMSESERFMQELFTNSSTSQSLGTESSISSEQDDVLTVVDKSQPPAPPPQTMNFSVLKAKLDMACAAAATIFGGNSSSQPEDSRGNHFSSDSSNEDLEINDVAGARREKRKGPNRDSTKYCSRKREHDNINTLDAKIYELMDENASLVSQIADMKKKHDEAVADNVTVKSEIMTLKATVTVVERIVKQLLRMNPDVLLMLNSPNEGHGQQIGQGRGLISPSASASTNVGVPIQPNYIVGIPCGTANVPVNHEVGIAFGLGVGVNGPFPSTSTVPVNHGVGVNGPFPSAGTVPVNHGVGVNGPFPSAGTVPVNHGVGVNGPFPSASTVLVNHGLGLGVGVNGPFPSAGTIPVNHGVGVNGPFPLASTATTVFRDQTQIGMPLFQQGNNLFGLGHTFLA